MGQLLDLMNKYGSEMVQAMKQILIDHNKGDSNFINSLNYRVIQDIDSISTEFIMEDYAKWVDQGRSAGKMPPLEKIGNWTARKGLPESSVFPIAKNIGKFGLPATNFLSVFETSKDKFKSEIEKASAADLAEFIKNENK